MKKLIYGGLFLALLGIGVVSCEKENIERTNTDFTENNATFTTKEAPRKGEIACSIKDSNGNEIAIGKRCGTPTGDCGRTYTACKAVARRSEGRLPEGMSYEEFQTMWNDETQRSELQSLGYYAEDIK